MSCAVQDLADRYGKPLIVLNLVKGAEKRPRESVLQSEFANAISYINKGVSVHTSVAPQSPTSERTPSAWHFSPSCRPRLHQTPRSWHQDLTRPSLMLTEH